MILGIHFKTGKKVFVEVRRAIVDIEKRTLEYNEKDYYPTAKHIEKIKDIKEVYVLVQGDKDYLYKE